MYVNYLDQLFRLCCSLWVKNWLVLVFMYGKFKNSIATLKNKTSKNLFT